jgi:hypothetical protein
VDLLFGECSFRRPKLIGVGQLVSVYNADYVIVHNLLAELRVDWSGVAASVSHARNIRLIMNDIESLAIAALFRTGCRMARWGRQRERGKNNHENYSLAKYATLDT